MKKDNFKKAAPKATTPRPSLLRRGLGRFGVSKKENGLWLYGFAARIVKRVSVSRLVWFSGFVRRKLFTIQAAKTYNFKPKFQMIGNFRAWHKISVAFASIAVIGIVVFFQFAPEKAQAKI